MSYVIPFAVPLGAAAADGSVVVERADFGSGRTFYRLGTPPLRGERGLGPAGMHNAEELRAHGVSLQQDDAIVPFRLGQVLSVRTVGDALTHIVSVCAFSEALGGPRMYFLGYPVGVAWHGSWHAENDLDAGRGSP